VLTSVVDPSLAIPPPALLAVFDTTALAFMVRLPEFRMPPP
jgi:hypothetical protein